MIYDIAIIGGGAAGIVSAISAVRSGQSVVICERLPQLGKKILATGNGRCNLLNDNLSEEFYNLGARTLVKSVFARFGKKEILEFFNGIGLETYSQDGRIFPVTNQAASVLKVLEMELRRLNIPVELNFTCASISFSDGRILVASKEGTQIECRKAVITGGGKTYPALGSDGSIFEIAKQLGHTIVAPVPSAVPLVTRDPLCQALQGQRIIASARSLIESVEGKPVGGELLFTKYGLSGSCVVDTSEEISIALNRDQKRNVSIVVDLVPFMSKIQLRNELVHRKKTLSSWSGTKNPGAGDVAPSADELLVGILPNKCSAALARIVERDDLDSAVGVLKGMRFKVDGTRGWNEAEFTAGGIVISEIDPESLESKIKKGVYFAGEVLDVDGKRGGYNLAWAWASGWVAGLDN
jgi:predicted Rossmann fold flavoprotein